jgi:hypothetical protein
MGMPPTATSRPGASVPSRTPTKTFSIGPPVPRGQKIGIYGAGGTGKTTLAALIEHTAGPVGFVDIEDSLGILMPRLNELGLSPQSVQGIQTWGELLTVTDGDSDIFAGVNTIAIDTMTEAETMAINHVVETVPMEKGEHVTSIESYGYGKGYRYLQDTFYDLRNELNVHVAKGRNVIVLMHDSVASVPNPEGADWIRYEPRLYQDKSVSIRRFIKEWCDHLLYIGYDVEAKKGSKEKHGKATGSGSRTIYPTETATCWAKSRSLSDPIPYDYGDDALWRALFNK